MKTDEKIVQYIKIWIMGAMAIWAFFKVGYIIKLLEIIAYGGNTSN